jgi:hypothetical protein
MENLPGFLTVATPCCIRQVRVLRASVRRFHPGVSFQWLKPEVPPAASAATQMSQAVAYKPWAIRQALEKNERVVFLDPDTRLYAPLTPMLEGLRKHSLMLSPHQIHPSTGLRCAERDQNLVISGVCNGGVIGVRRTPETLRFLDWWIDRVARDPVSRPADGLFFDQKWLDFAPVWVSDAGWLRDPGLNLGHWRLPEHSLTQDVAAWQVDGEPLRLFHFSGFDPEQPGRLTVYACHVSLDAPPSEALRDLLAEYACALQDADLRGVEREYERREDLQAAFPRRTRRDRIRWWIWTLLHARREVSRRGGRR